MPRKDGLPTDARMVAHDDVVDFTALSISGADDMIRLQWKDGADDRVHDLPIPYPAFRKLAAWMTHAMSGGESGRGPRQ